MPQYVCKLGTPQGEIIEKTFVADNEEKLRLNLKGEGYHIFNIAKRHIATEALGALIKRRQRIRQDDFLVFNQEFAALIRAGLPIVQGLDLLLERMRPGLLKESVERISRLVKEGKTLSEAVEMCGDIFPPIYAASLRAGEKSGNIQEVLARFIKYTRIAIETKKKVLSMLIYPTILFCAAGVVISILLFYALPNFASLYADFGSEMPVMTRIIIAVSRFTGANSVFILLLVVGVFVFYNGYRQTARGRVRIDRFKLQIPVVGALISKYNTSQYARTLATLLAGGIPAVQALNIAGTSLQNGFFAERLKIVVGRVEEGARIHKAMDETNLFEPLAVEMVKVGESTGAIVDMLNNLSEFYDDDVTTSLTRFITVLEPAILVGLAVIVGTILVSLYLPIFETIKLA